MPAVVVRPLFTGFRRNAVPSISAFTSREQVSRKGQAPHRHPTKINTSREKKVAPSNRGRLLDYGSKVVRLVGRPSIVSLSAIRPLHYLRAPRSSPDAFLCLSDPSLVSCRPFSRLCFRPWAGQTAQRPVSWEPPLVSQRQARASRRQAQVA